MASTLIVNEIFGPTLQGEGPSLGRPCAFLRVSGCNQHCVWCDTPYTWDWKNWDIKKEAHKTLAEDVVKRLKEHLPKINPMLVISGGEPLLQQSKLTEVMSLLKDDLDLDGIWIEVETAGTIEPENEFDFFVDAYNVSPKLEHSGNELSLRYRPEALEALRDTGKVQGWKFVAQEPGDLYEIAALVDKHDLSPVYVMPEGKNQADLSRHAEGLVEAIIARGWRMTPRLHIQLWGTERGR